MWRPSIAASPAFSIVQAYVIDVLPNRLDAEAHVELVLEAEHAMELRLDVLARIVAPALEEPDPAHAAPSPPPPPTGTRR